MSNPKYIQQCPFFHCSNAFRGMFYGIFSNNRCVFLISISWIIVNCQLVVIASNLITVSFDIIYLEDVIYFEELRCNLFRRYNLFWNYNKARTIISIINRDKTYSLFIPSRGIAASLINRPRIFEFSRTELRKWNLEIKEEVPQLFRSLVLTDSSLDWL